MHQRDEEKDQLKTYKLEVGKLNMSGFSRLFTPEAKQERYDKYLKPFVEPAYDFFTEDVAHYVPPELRYLGNAVEIVDFVTPVLSAMQNSGEAFSGTDYYGNDLTPNERVSKGMSALIDTTAVAGPAVAGTYAALRYAPKTKYLDEISDNVVDIFTGGMASSKTDAPADPSRRKALLGMGAAVIAASAGKKFDGIIPSERVAKAAAKPATNAMLKGLRGAISAGKEKAELVDNLDMIWEGRTEGAPATPIDKNGYPEWVNDAAEGGSAEYGSSLKAEYDPLKNALEDYSEHTDDFLKMFEENEDLVGQLQNLTDDELDDLALYLDDIDMGLRGPSKEVDYLLEQIGNEASIRKFSNEDDPYKF